MVAALESEGAYCLAKPKSGVSTCDKFPPAVRSMLAGKEEAAEAQGSAAAAEGYRQGLCSRPYKAASAGQGEDELHTLVVDL